MKDNQIFALDIGTRKIVGLVMEKGPASYQVVDAEMIEHSTRAMMDGQIHDVEAVAAAIQEIKNRLENRLGSKLEAAAVAAAGRALKTACGQIRKKRGVLNEMTRDEVQALEIEAVQQAQYQLSQQDGETKERGNYFCVGYSVTRYLLEDQEIGSLIGQVGAGMAVEVVATFLPRVVVDSLFSSLKRAGLEVASLTLEPIAALSVAIPPSMRLLNLALVDIGAGTSDIAIVKEGKILAYAMVPVGGDELTEFLAGEYLLDFNSAEAMKRKLDSEPEVEMIDILGNKSVISSSEVIEGLHRITGELARDIAGNILSLNLKAPSAVICVGGGSLTPKLTGALAAHLELSANRVGYRAPGNVNEIEFTAEFLRGPQGVTPLGIAYNCFTIPPVPFTRVSVNGGDIALWNMGELTVTNALLSSGISLANIYGKPGLGKTIEVNGYVKIYKGEMGTPPAIKVNGEPATLETPVREGDCIEFAPGVDGKNVDLRVKDIMPALQGQAVVNGEKTDMQPVVMINGRRSEPDEEIPDRAKIDYKSVNSLQNILLRAGVGEQWLEKRQYRYFLDDREMFVQWSPLEVTVNGIKADINDKVENGAEIVYSTGRLYPSISDLLGENEQVDLVVTVNGDQVRLKGKGAGITMNGQRVSRHEPIEEGARLYLDRGQGLAILSDIFQIIEMKPVLSGRLLIKVDGEPAGFTTPIRNGSVIELNWES
ncbi:MAG: cell division FtsA domain-containing protein [Deltaproteobacteria bacterium]